MKNRKNYLNNFKDSYTMYFYIKTWVVFTIFPTLTVSDVFIKQCKNSTRGSTPIRAEKSNNVSLQRKVDTEESYPGEFLYILLYSEDL